MVILTAIQVFITLLFFIFGWAILKKEAYGIISGFATRPKEEQKQLIENGFPQKTGRLFIFTGFGMLILLPLSFTSFIYAVEVQFGFMLVFLLGGIIFLSKYELPHKRKRSYMISISLFVVVMSSLGYLSFIGYQDYKLVIRDDSFEITGMYGDEWKFKDINKLEVLEKMPEVTVKQNGFGTASMAKGVFSVKGYGSSLLFIKHGASSEILYIEARNKKIFINGKDTSETKGWFEQLQMYTE
jgi:hypothetical protein